MAANSKIEWTTHTLNPWRGCQKIAPGCKNCYAETRSNRFGEDFSGQRIRLSDAGWREPLKWNRDAEQAGERQRVFCASLADVFEDWDGPIVDHRGDRLFNCDDGYRLTPIMEQPAGLICRAATMADLRRDLFSLIDRTPWLIWIMLTKRPENIRRMWPATDFDRKNVWLLTSASDQTTADRNWDHLVDAGGLAPVIGMSLEPLLGPIDIWQSCRNGPAPNWIIVGGESGPDARPCDLAWIRSLRDQCRASEVPCFVKQLGSHVVFKGIQQKLKHPKGGDPAEWPEDIRVREFPTLAEGNTATER